MDKGPLHDLRVIDFGQYVAGPMLGMMLADQGADVIRVDPPGGPRWDSPAANCLARNKRAIVLDLKDDADNKVAGELVAGADVLIENFRPGVMSRLGLDREELTAVHPRLIYISIPGFASADKERAHIQAWEGVIGAATGLFTDQGLNRLLMKNGEPYYTPLTLASAYAVSLAATAVMTALVQREQTGRGDILEVPIASAVLEGLVYNSMVFEPMPERYQFRRAREYERRKKSGEPMNLSYEEIQELLEPTYRNYICADGRPFYNETVGIHRHAVDSFKLHGIYDELVEAGFPLHEPWTSSSAWGEGEFSVSSNLSSQYWADELSSRLKASFKTRTSREWEHLYEEWRLAGAAQQTAQEWLADEHANTSGLIVTVDDAEYGLLKQPGITAWLQDHLDRADAMEPARAAGVDREQILAELTGYQKESMGSEAGESESALPLAGLKILDITNVLGGPTIASTLARFGAEVIHLGPNKPSFEPAECMICGSQCHKGKRSILVDLKSPEGHRILLDLVKQVDLVTYNGTDKQISRLGIGYETLKAANPDVILCQLTAFAGPRPGSRSNRLGYDDLTQAITGIMARFGGALETPEEHANIGTIDVMGGFLGAYAALLALYKLKRGEGGGIAQTSLTNCAQMLQTPFMFDYAGRGPFDEPRGRDANGEGALYRIYRASDGWFFLGVKPERLADLAVIPELAGVVVLEERELESYMEEAFSTEKVDYWLEQLRTLDLGAYPTDRMHRLREAYLVDQDKAEIRFDNGTFLFLHNEDHPSGHTVDLIAPIGMRFKHSQVRNPSDQAKFGDHTLDVIKELGYSDSTLEELLQKGVIATGWSDKHLPD